MDLMSHQIPDKQLTQSLIFIAILLFVIPAITTHLPLGELAKGVITVCIYAIASLISWRFGRLRASIGWLFFALSMCVLLFIGVNNDLPALMAFFACLVAGFGLVVSEGLVET